MPIFRAAHPVILLLISSAICLFATDKELAIDLAPHGFVQLQTSFNSLDLRPINGQVSFLSPTSVAVSFVVPTEGQLAPRGSVGNSNWIVRTLLFGVSGDIQSQWEWRNATNDARVIARNNCFFVSGGGRFEVHNENGKIIWTMQLPKTTIARSRPFGHVFLSATGSTVSIMSDISANTESVDTYATADGKLIANGLSIPVQGIVGAQAATDDGFLYTTESFPYYLMFAPFSGDPTKALRTCRVSRCANHIQPGGDNTFIFDDSEHSISRIDLHGNLLNRIAFGKKNISELTISHDQSRLLVRLNEFKGGSRAFDVFPRLKVVTLVVLEARTLKKISSIDIDASSPVLGASISESGDLVAYVRNHFLYVWQVTPGVPPIGGQEKKENGRRVDLPIELKQPLRLSNIDCGQREAHSNLRAAQPELENRLLGPNHSFPS
jgi:hypothetical protein